MIVISVLDTLQILAWRFFFYKILVLEPIESSHIQEVYPSTSLDESSIEIEFETDRSIYLDMRDFHLQIKVGLQKGRLFYNFMKKEEQTRYGYDFHR